MTFFMEKPDQIFDLHGFEEILQSLKRVRQDAGPDDVVDLLLYGTPEECEETRQKIRQSIHHSEPPSFSE